MASLFDTTAMPSGPKFFRPQLNELESRLAPAVLVWNPTGSNTASNIKNWSDESGNAIKGGAFKLLQDTFVFDNRSNNAICNWDLGLVRTVKIESGYGNPTTPGTINLLTDMQINLSFVCEATNVVFSSTANKKIAIDPNGIAGVKVTWAGNTVSKVPVDFGAGVVATLSGGSKEFQSTVTVSGQVDWTQGNMAVNQFLVSSGGIFGVSGNLTLSSLGQNSKITNSGTFQRTAGNGLLVITTGFENKGKFVVGTGEVRLDSAGKQTGATSSTILEASTKLTLPVTLGNPNIIRAYNVQGGTFTARDQTTFQGALWVTNATLNVATKSNGAAILTLNGALKMTTSVLGIVLTNEGPGNAPRNATSRVDVNQAAGNWGDVDLTDSKVKFSVAQGRLDTPKGGAKPFLTWAGNRTGGNLAWTSDNKTWAVGGVTGKITNIAPLDALKNPKKAYTVTVESKGFNLPPPPPRPGQVKGAVWIDDNDGVFGPGEAGAAGQSVYLLDANSNVVAATSTASDGTYEFDNLPTGTYFLTTDLPLADIFSTHYTGNDPNAVSVVNPATGTSDTLVLTSTSLVVNASIGLVNAGGVDGAQDPSPMLDPGGADPEAPQPPDAPMTAAIYGRLFLDANYNGQQDSGELGSAGTSVNLLDGQGVVLASAVSDSDGFYVFDGLAVGNYRVQVSRPSGLAFTSEHAAPVGADSDVDSTGLSDLVVIGSVNDIPKIDAGFIAMGATTTTLSASSQSSYAGQQITYTAAVSKSGYGFGTPGGTVSFFDGTTLLGTSTLSQGMPQATFTTALSVGSHSITAVYNGSTMFTGSTSNAVTETVSKATDMSWLTASSSSVQFGHAVTFTDTVSEASPWNATGTVSFYDNGVLLAVVTLNQMEQALLTLSNLSIGSHTITATYSGDANFNSSSATFAETVYA